MTRLATSTRILTVLSVCTHYPASLSRFGYDCITTFVQKWEDIQGKKLPSPGLEEGNVVFTLSWRRRCTELFAKSSHVGAHLCVRPNLGRHIGLPLRDGAMAL